MAIKDYGLAPDSPLQLHPSPYPKQTCVTKHWVAKGKVCADMKNNPKLLLNNMNRVIHVCTNIYHIALVRASLDLLFCALENGS